MTFVLPACDTLPSKFRAHENSNILPPKEELLPYAWRLVYKDYQNVIFNVSDYLPDFVLFVNRSGDQIWFDGKSILKAEVNSHEILYHSYDPENLTVFFNAQELSKHKCSKWSDVIVDNIRLLEQNCVGKEDLIRTVSYTSVGMVQEIAVKATPDINLRLIKITDVSDL